MTEPTAEVPPATRTARARKAKAPAKAPAKAAATAPAKAPAEAPAKAPATSSTTAPTKRAPRKRAPVTNGTTAAPSTTTTVRKRAAGGAPVAPGPSASHAPVTLCIDVGGTGIKGTAVGADGAMLGDRVKIATTYPLEPSGLVEQIAEIARRSPAATRVSIGFPGMVRAGKVLSAPHFVTKKGPGTKVVPELVQAWSGFDLSSAVDAALHLPTRLANDADTQGLAAIKGQGMELVITLGTGIGTALFLDGELQTHIELSHHQLLKGVTYNEYVGNVAYLKLGKKRWTKRVEETIAVLQALTFYDTLYIGGGNAENLAKGFGPTATIVSNADGILGGAKLWSLHRVP